MTAARRAERVALVPWGTPLEVFLEPLGRTLDDFCERLDGGWLFGYAAALAAAGRRPVLVVSSRAVAHPEVRRHLPTGTPVTVLPWSRPDPPPPAPGLRGDLTAYRRALPRGLLTSLRTCDAVVLQEYEEPRADLLAAWGALRRVPVLASFQGGVPPWYRAPVQRAVRGPALRRLAGLLVGSSAEARRLVTERRVDPARVHRVVNPVDTSVWRPQDRAAARAALGVPASARVVAWHGRVDVPRKGLDVLVQAWVRLCAAHPDEDLRLLLVGSGPDAPLLRELLGAPGVRGVAWLDAYAGAEQVRQRLAACDLWVSPSRHEGFAVAPLEAMASGRPVVVTDAPGAVELVGPEDGGPGGIAGVSVVRRDDAGALAAALATVLADPAALAAAGGAARRRAEQAFSPTAVAAQLTTALDSACTVGAQRDGRSG